MTQQTKTQSTNSYNQGSMNNYDTFQSSGAQALNGIVNDPYTNTFFQGQNAMMRQQNASAGASAQQALLQRIQALGQGNNSLFLNSQIGQIQRGTMANNAQGYNQLLLNAAQTRLGGISSMLNYKPLQTGQTQTQTTGGLGSWLPQLAGAALGGITGGLTGGLMGGGHGPGDSFFSGANQAVGTSAMPSNFSPMTDTSGGAFGEGDNPWGNPNDGAYNPFLG